MTDDEENGVLRLVFSEIRPITSSMGPRIEFRPLQVWEPYIEAVLARQRQAQDTLAPVTTSERKTGLKRADVITAQPLQDDRGWLRLAS